METSKMVQAAALKDVLRRAIRNDFLSFIRKSFETLSPGTPYLANWHIEAIAWHLEQVRLGAIKRLIITMPPRSLKSVSASVAFPAFIHGHDPTAEIVCASYAQDLSAKLHNDYRAVLRSAWYRAAFPATCISHRKDTETETLLTERGSRFATSVGGVLTGRGADIIVVDDPLKPADANSQAKRAQVNDWFRSTLISRLNDKKDGAIVIVTQRVHADDLIGNLLEFDHGEWTVLNLPAICAHDYKIQVSANRFHAFKVGDVLHPSREPLSVLESLRHDIGSDAFNAQYLQTPVPPGGNMFRRAWLTYYDRLPTGNGDVIQSWDTASKTEPHNDWSVCTTWYVERRNYYLVDLFREKLDYTQLRRKAIELARNHDPRMILIEETNIGTGLIVDMKAHGFRARAVTAIQSKEARAAVQTPKFEGGLVHFPRQRHWLPDLLAELLAFPGGRHDDQVDSMVQALAYDLTIGRSYVGTVQGVCS